MRLINRVQFDEYAPGDIMGPYDLLSRMPQRAIGDGNVDEAQKRQIESILGEMECPKGFACYETGFENLCRAEDIGLERLLYCLEEDAAWCRFATSFGHRHMCRCPLRVYLAKNLKV
jgi:hypothetical protein